MYVKNLCKNSADTKLLKEPNGSCKKKRGNEDYYDKYNKSRFISNF